MSNLLYIGPGLGTAAIVLVFIIAGIVVFAFAYIFWAKLKRFFRKKNKK